jgi:hypothetical protein
VSSLGLGDASAVTTPAMNEGALASHRMRASLMLAALTVTVVAVACSKPIGEPPAPSASTRAVAVANDGNDPHAPVLSPDDVSFVDDGHGFAWNDRCWKEERKGKYGWAVACCKKALDSPHLDRSLEGSFFYTEAMALEGAGDMAGAKTMYERSLESGPSSEPGEPAVAEAIRRVSRPLTDRSRAVSFPCGRIRCATGRLCYGDEKCIDPVPLGDPDPDPVPGFMLAGCDLKTHEPCDAKERCWVDSTVPGWHCAPGARDAGPRLDGDAYP